VSPVGRDEFLARLERDSLVVALGLASAAGVLWPSRPERAFGVLGGLLLVALSYRGIRAGVDGIWPSDTKPPVGSAGDANRLETPPPGARGRFVKYFTRHAILALGAYVMMARFGFDPMAMLVGVSAPVIAATVEFVRIVRARQGGSSSKLS
jgi:hypothetical protein